MTEPTIQALDWALRGGTVALLLLVAAALGRDHGRLVPARLGMLFALGSAAYAICSAIGMQGQPSASALPLLALSAGNTVVFWLFAAALFDDDFRLRPWHGAVWLLMIGLGAAARLAGGSKMLGIGLTSGALVFAAVALLHTVSSWRGDLVEERRRLRLFVVGAASLYAAAIALPQLAGATRSTSDDALTLIEAVALLTIAGTAAGSLLRAGGRQSLFRPIPAPVATAPDSALEAQRELAERRLITRLEQMMAVERLYRQEGLTIGALADRLGLSAYWLRRLINQRLGYRDFSGFLNRYRIREAKAALTDPAKAAIPILTIAMDAGFSSLGRFNRAFEAETGLTPAEHRRANMNVDTSIAKSASRSQTGEAQWSLGRQRS